MRQRQRGSSGVENAATCMGRSRLPPTPAVPAAPRPTAASAAAYTRGLGELYFQRPPVQFLAVELLHGGIGLLGRRHLDEAESARTSGVTVHHDRRRLDRAGLTENLTQPLIRGGEGQACDEELLSHGAPLMHLPQLTTLPGTRKTAPESWSGRRGPGEPTPRPDAHSVPRFLPGRWPYFAGPSPVSCEANRGVRLLRRRDGGSVRPRGALTGALI